MSFEVTVTPTVYDVEVSVNPSVQPFDVEVITQQDLADLVDEAKQYAEDAEDSADSASASASSASASALASANSASSASASASSASSSANTATTQAGIATSQAGIATTQAGIATTKAQEASQSASDALASEQASAQSASDALASEQASAQSASDALASEQASALSEANALASEQSALSSANTATVQAGIATTQAGNALTSANNALNSANAAAASAASAAQVGTSTLLTGFSVGSNATIASTDTILQAFNKTQGQINARVSSNLFTANGTLGGNRTITLGGFTLDVIGSTFTNRFSTAGRLLLGNPTESTFLLDVAGEARIVPSANATPLTISGYSLTGSNAQSALSITGTWNTTGTPILIFANVTDTASNASSLLMQLQVGGANRFRFRPDTRFELGTQAGVGIASADASNGAVLATGRSLVFFDTNGSFSGYSYYFRTYQYSNKNYDSGVGGMVNIARGFAPTTGTGIFNVLALENTINQTGGANGITRGLFVNPTLTAAADWRSIEWSNNTGWGLYGVGTANNYLNGNLLLGSTTSTGERLQVTGTARISASADAVPLTISGYSLTGSNAQSALSITGTWNTTGAPTLIFANVTNTASNANSLLMDLQVGGSSQFQITRAGRVGVVASTPFVGFTISLSGGVNSATNYLNVTGTISSTSGFHSNYSSGANFQPTSGSATFVSYSLSPTINQTGGANGITRGLFVNPTLTSAADWRSIEWSNNTGRGLWGVGTANNALAGATHIGSATDANASAILELTSTTRGLLLPRMTGAQAELIGTPADGLLVYINNGNGVTINSTGFWGRAAGAWVKLN
jgi:hypothetical protein